MNVIQQQSVALLENVARWAEVTRRAKSRYQAEGRCEQVDRTFTTNSLSAFEMPITPKT
ncbi:hypothetical protein [Aeromonas allosaccharophila]|uniref:hypothetical protein n=1 Tax=Aeromonas allosaccharophila TaxID=656 RepID=UPI002ADFE599|nr:hypothetical protein [Aeromonas allosaccharophila]